VIPFIRVHPEWATSSRRDVVDLGITFEAITPKLIRYVSEKLRAAIRDAHARGEDEVTITCQSLDEVAQLLDHWQRR
jgi:hypothetical protein